MGRGQTGAILGSCSVCKIVASVVDMCATGTEIRENVERTRRQKCFGIVRNNGENEKLWEGKVNGAWANGRKLR